MRTFSVHDQQPPLPGTQRTVEQHHRSAVGLELPDGSAVVTRNRRCPFDSAGLDYQMTGGVGQRLAVVSLDVQEEDRVQGVATATRCNTRAAGKSIGSPAMSGRLSGHGTANPSDPAASRHCCLRSGAGVSERHGSPTERSSVTDVLGFLVDETSSPVPHPPVINNNSPHETITTVVVRRAICTDWPLRACFVRRAGRTNRQVGAPRNAGSVEMAVRCRLQSRWARK